MEILLHIGLDTVDLKGTPFTMHVNENDEVSPSTLLVEANLTEIKAADKDPIVLTLITNTDTKVSDFGEVPSKSISHGDNVTQITLK